MKQKILYILMIITALLGGNGEAWAQPNVDGYSSPITDMDVITTAMFFRDWTDIQNRSTSYKANDYVTFILVGNDGFGINDVSAGGFKNDKKSLAATLSWSIKDGYYIYITQLSCSAFHTIVWNEPSHSINGAYAKTGGLSAGKATTATSSNLSLGNTNNVSITLGNTTSYMRQISAQYKIVHYTLITTALDESISYANSKSSSIDESIRSYLTTAINNGNTFKEACAFPNSYWNGSSVGKTPAEVTTTAEKLNAITNYLIARTNANQFEKSKVPNAVYDWLHTYDQYDPNDFDANTINTATNDINAAISAASATTSAYQSALTTIASAENSFDKTNDQETLTADIAKAKEQLELAKSVEEINSALANIKSFDAITFDSQNEIQEGRTLDNTASTISGNAITYTSSDNTIIDGTTLKALKAGTVTITATTTTGNGYYGCTTTKVFTVTPKAVILYPNVECTIVPNIVYPEITLERSFSAKKHYTLTLPFDSNISDIDGDYAAQLALVTYNKADGYTLYFQKVTDGQMVANQPYVVYLPNTIENPTWENVTVSTPEAESIEVNGWTMQGNYTPGLSMSGKYGIAGGEFCLGTEKSSINAYTAYFTFLGTENVRTRVAVMDGSGNTTYIGELSDLNGNAAEEVFGIDGMRLPEMKKGINIVRQKDGSVRKIVK